MKKEKVLWLQNFYKIKMFKKSMHFINGDLSNYDDICFVVFNNRFDRLFQF
jgi:hypothetical protein